MSPSERQLVVLVHAQLATAKVLLLEMMAAADPKQLAQCDAILALLSEASKQLNAMVPADDAEGPAQ